MRRYVNLSLASQLPTLVPIVAAVQTVQVVDRIKRKD